MSTAAFSAFRRAARWRRCSWKRIVCSPSCRRAIRSARRSAPLAALGEEPFLLLEKGAKAEIAALFERAGLTPCVRFTTWDDYAVMSMVESGLGLSILPELILRRIPYRLAIRPLDVPATRRIGFAVRSFDRAPLAVRRFLDYLPCRSEET